MRWEILTTQEKKYRSRYGALSVVDGNKIYIVGGYYGSVKSSKEILCYNFGK